MTDDDRHLSYDLTKSNSVHNGIVALQVHTPGTSISHSRSILIKGSKRECSRTRAHTVKMIRRCSLGKPDVDCSTDRNNKGSSSGWVIMRGRC